MPDLIAPDEVAYEALALRIYRDRDYHCQLKRRVRDGVAHGALYDVRRYTCFFEQALLHVYERQQQGLAPYDLDVAALDLEAVMSAT